MIIAQLENENIDVSFQNIDDIDVSPPLKPSTQIG